MSQPTMPQIINLTQAWAKTNPNVKALNDSVSRFIFKVAMPILLSRSLHF